MSKIIKIEGLVESTLIATAPKTLLSYQQEAVKVTMEGLEGDNHAGMTMLANSRQPYYTRGTVIRNFRQVSILSVEELAQVARGMALSEVRAAWLGANLLLRNVPNLTQLPPSTRLFFPQEAVLVVEGENFPCNGPARLIQSQFPDTPNLAAAFLKHAMHKRGLVGWVERPGYIGAGDTVRVEVAPQVIYSIG